jgi:hypothetical protein
MQVTKQVVDTKKQEALVQLHNPANPGYLNHRNSQRTNRVDYNTFRKSDSERQELKRLKKAATKSTTTKIVFQF